MTLGREGKCKDRVSLKENEQGWGAPVFAKGMEAEWLGYFCVKNRAGTYLNKCDRVCRGH